MKAIQIGNRYEIYDDSLKTYDELPAKTYVVQFSKMSGFYLEEYSDFEIKENKIYGIHDAKVDKVIKSYKSSNRSLGVILSGSKGIGKSLFAKMLSKEAINHNLPVIIVNSAIPGTASYIEKIEQEVVVLFDEFDKIFTSSRRDEGPDLQTEFLTLFDGTASGKKMFIITCNELYNLNEFLINRPGRFHYHFRFNYPTHQEIRIYLQDNLKEEYHDQIEDVIKFSRKVNLNYDCLRAVAFELNLGESFKDAIQDLNIINLTNEQYMIELHYQDGTVVRSENYVGIDMFDNAVESFYVCDSNDNYIEVSFTPCECQYDALHDVNVIGPNNFKLRLDEVRDKKAEAKYKNLTPAYLSFVKRKQKNLHYLV